MKAGCLKAYQKALYPSLREAARTCIFRGMLL